MTIPPKRDIFFSFFMFTVDVRPEDPEYTKVLIKHLLKLDEIGYDGYDLHIAPRAASVSHQSEVESYARMKDAFDKAFDDAGRRRPKFATNVGTTPYFDPTSPYEEQREAALAYLKSRVDITSVLNGGAADSIMSGPFIYPYGAFPLSDLGEAMWSDALLDWMEPRYRAAQPIIDEVAQYAQQKRVTLAIEPVKNWETPPPNMVSDILRFLDGVKTPCGITIDTAQSLMENDGPSIFKEDVASAASRNQLAYVHISSPDRGKIDDCWIPWDVMLGEIEPVYQGPYLIEVFNAIPPLDAGMRMTRRRYWREGEDQPNPKALSAYQVAETGLAEIKHQIHRVHTGLAKQHATAGDAGHTPEGRSY